MTARGKSAVALFLGVLCFPLVHASPVFAQTRVEVTKPTVRPGDRQTVVVRGPSGVPVQIEVVFPNGETMDAPTRTFGGSGVVRWSFAQPPNAITHDRRTATVRATVNTQTVETRYVIAFAPLDLVSPHGAIEENSEVTLWVHSRAGTRVSLQIMASGVTRLVHLVTGPRGWSKHVDHFSNAAAPFEPKKVSVTASVELDGHTHVVRSDFRVKPFQFSVWLDGVQVLHREGGVWVPTTSVHAGEMIRIVGSSYIREPAGTMPYCVEAHVTLAVPGVQSQMAPLQCDSSGNPGDRVADLQIPDSAAPGSGQITIDASFINGSAHVVVPLTVVSG